MVNEGLFKALVEHSDDIVIVTDVQFKIRYASSSVTKIFRVEPVKVIGSNLFNYVSADRSDRWQARLADQQITSFRDEISIHLDNKKVYFDVEVTNLSARTPFHGLMIKLHDITEKKSREKELIRSNEQLDQVIFKTTHDLRAPLMSAMGLLNLAEKAPAYEVHVYLAMIRKSLLKLDSFIKEVNDFFRNEKLALQRSRLDVEELLQEELSHFTETVRDSRISVKVCVSAAAEFYSDSLRLKTIVGNILSNAIKYFDPQKSEPFLHISVSINEDFCELRFQDNGIGIEPEYHQKIFDLFFRATTHSDGTGLGLFLVRDTVQRMNGSIELVSTPGEGSVFTVRIPNQISQPIEAV